MHTTSFLTRAELAVRWRISRQTLANWAATGRGPTPVRFGGAVRYSLETIREFESSCQRHNASKRRRRQTAGR